MKTLSITDCKHMILGSTILSAGGGIPFLQQLRILSQVNKPLTLQSVSQIETTVLIPFEIGPATSDAMTSKPLIQALLSTLKRNRLTFDCVMPAELGQESVAFLTAHLAQKPVLNLDMAGGRAAPRLPINVFTALNMPFTFSPLIIGGKGNLFRAITHQGDIHFAERKLRNAVRLLAKARFVATIATIKNPPKILKNTHTLTQALRVGNMTTNRKMLSNKNIFLHLEGKVEGVTLNTRNGFSHFLITIRGANGDIFRILNQNENLILFKGQTILSQVPDIITLFSTTKYRGLHSSEVKVGENVRILVLQPSAIWRTNQGQNIWKAQTLTRRNNRI